MSSGSEKRARTKHLTIRFTPDERAEVDADAERAGLTPGSYGRSRMLNGSPPRQVRRPPIERQELARLLGQLGSIGNNLNQVARVLNSGDAADEPALLQAIDDLHVMRDAVLSALGRAQ